MIAGVRVKQIKVNCDERGKLFEVLRSDEELFQKFGQVYITTAYPGVIKAWHVHKSQIDNMSVVKGRAKFALYDGREESSTYGEINEFFPGDDERILIQIPPGVYHGFKNIGWEELWVMNIPTDTYNDSDPDEVRIDPFDNRIPYDWTRRDADRRYLICGGCGFIGSNFVHALCASESDAQITVVDLLTYAGSTDNLEPLLTTKRVDFVKVDITDAESLRSVFEREFDVVVNFAAETHVDRSLYYSNAFVRTNILGVDILLSLCREFRVPFLQVSTDEVYGSAPEGVPSPNRVRSTPPRRTRLQRRLLIY